jgi:hypothetical protein
MRVKQLYTRNPTRSKITIPPLEKPLPRWNTIHSPPPPPRQHKKKRRIAAIPRSGRVPSHSKMIFKPMNGPPQATNPMLPFCFHFPFFSFRILIVPHYFSPVFTFFTFHMYHFNIIIILRCFLFFSYESINTLKWDII